MPPQTLDDPSTPATGAAVLRLVVRNHAGVMSHVCGLFARRGFNLDGILCVPIGSGERSAMLLLVRDDERLEQTVRQLEKLEDVLVLERLAGECRAFADAARWLEPSSAP
jgi:acetolactate synthase-1/3 small subunit